MTPWVVRPSIKFMSFLVLFVEETFATAEFFSTSKSVDQSLDLPLRKTWYLPKESLKNGLQSFVQTHVTGHGVEKIYVIDRFTKKILKFRLGGSVALITVPGLAKFHELTLQGTYGDLRFHPEAKPALSSEDLRFEILETTKCLTEIEPKLKLMGCKRILAHHPQMNESSEVTKSFEALGYEIYCIPYRSSLEELRRGLLSLSVQGTFEDLETEIRAALGDEIQILWLGDKGFQKNLVADRFSFLMAWPANKNEQIFMGWDQFYFLKDGEPARALEAGLGSVFEFESASYQWTSNQSLDPGPMSFGRGQKLMALDFFVEEFLQQGFLTELVNKEKFESKWNMQWKVCQKFHPKLTPASLREEWFELILIEAFNRGASENVAISGPAAHLLEPMIRKSRSPLLKKIQVQTQFRFADWISQ